MSARKAVGEPPYWTSDEATGSGLQSRTPLDLQQYKVYHSDGSTGTGSVGSHTEEGHMARLAKDSAGAEEHEREKCDAEGRWQNTQELKAHWPGAEEEDDQEIEDSRQGHLQDDAFDAFGGFGNGSWASIDGTKKPATATPDTTRKARGQADGRKRRTEFWLNQRIVAMSKSGEGSSPGSMVMKLLDFADKHHQSMNGMNFATTFHRIAKMTAAASPATRHQVLKDPRFQRLRGVLEAAIRQAAEGMEPDPSSPPGQNWVLEEPWLLSIIVWAYATLRVLPDRGVVNVAAVVIATHIHRFKPFEASNVLWGFAKMHIQHPVLFTAGAEAVIECPSKFSKQCLSIIAWAFATVRLRHAALLQAIADEMAKNRWECKSQEISNTLWAFATLSRPAPTLFRELGQEALQKLSTFKAQELSNTIWAFAVVGSRVPQLFRAAAEAAIQISNTLEPQNIANLLWAFAKMRLRCSSVGHLLRIALKQLYNFKPQEISSTLWAIAKLQMEDRECAEDNPWQLQAREMFLRDSVYFCSEVQQAVLHRLGTFSPQALANSVWACVQTGTLTAAFLQGVCVAAMSCVSEFEPLSLCNLLNGIGTYFSYGAVAPDGIELCLAHKIICEAHNRIAIFRPQELVKLVQVVTDLVPLGWPELMTLLEAVHQLARKKHLKFTLPQLGELVHSLALLGVKAPQLYQIFGERVLRNTTLLRAKERMGLMLALHVISADPEVSDDVAQTVGLAVASIAGPMAPEVYAAQDGDARQRNGSDAEGFDDEDVSWSGAWHASCAAGWSWVSGKVEDSSADTETPDSLGSQWEGSEETPSVTSLDERLGAGLPIPLVDVACMCKILATSVRDFAATYDAPEGTDWLDPRRIQVDGVVPRLPVSEAGFFSPPGLSAGTQTSTASAVRDPEGYVLAVGLVLFHMLTHTPVKDGEWKPELALLDMAVVKTVRQEEILGSGDQVDRLIELVTRCTRADRTARPSLDQLVQAFTLLQSWLE